MKINLDYLSGIRKQYINDKQFVNILSALVGLLVGLAAVAIKNFVFLIQNLLKDESLSTLQHYFYFVYPIFGVLLVILFVKYIVREKVQHGIPSVLYSIAETKGHIKKHNLFSSIVTAGLTVGFGGSVGLEGPTVVTGAAYGSAIGRFFKLNYKQIIILLGAACAGAMSAIFKAPIAGIVFAIEVIMIDLTISSVLPLLISSLMAVLTSYLFLGSEVLYHFELKEAFKMIDLPFFILLAILTGLISAYFTKIYIFIQKKFGHFKNPYLKLSISGLILGILIFLFPALYGEGYKIINAALAGNVNFIVESSIINSISSNTLMGLLIIGLIILLKSFATSFTFSSGGVGGIFAPTLFMGSLSGLLFASIFNQIGYHLPIENFALAAMAGTIAGVLQAPLTAIFLIAEISGGYQLLIPLMIVSLISYLSSHLFIKNSVYTYQLAQRGQLITHHADRNMLKLIHIEQLIETDFKTINPIAKLGDLVKLISISSRNIFPVVKSNGDYVGIIKFSDVRNIIFKPNLYDKIKITELITYPEFVITKNETMENIAYKLNKHEVYNIPVVENGKYIGFISRANFFAEYRKLLKEFSED
ncbi:MAG: chloride channel protein [Bacteroidetes bacterium CG2_30_33_31]|nr:MAG: chloride channel protein [Bacteroidetes bacterium CG2_30_33_31]